MALHSKYAHSGENICIIFLLCNSSLQTTTYDVRHRKETKPNFYWNGPNYYAYGVGSAFKARSKKQSQGPQGPDLGEVVLDT